MEILTNLNIIFYVLAYVIGGIPFGVIIAKKFAGVDVRASGSQSIGATNVLRVVKEKDPVLAKKLSIATFGFDAFKGAVIISIAMLTDVPEATYWTIAILAVMGHCFSPFLRLQGGKGVATAIGSIMVLLPIEGALGLVAWFIVGKTLKISSISSLAGVVAAVALSFVIHPDIAHAPIVILGMIIFYKHIPNIIRLFKKEETKIV